MLKRKKTSLMNTKNKEIEMECLVCGDRIQRNPDKRIMCEGCGNGIYAPVSGLLLSL